MKNLHQGWIWKNKLCRSAFGSSAWQGLSDQTLSGILAVFPVIRVFPVNLGTDPVPYFHGDWSWISTVILLSPAESLHILTGVFFLEWRASFRIIIEGHHWGPPRGFGNKGNRAFISGEQGNKGQIWRGTREQRHYWGTGNILRKQIFNFYGTWEQANLF